MPWPVIAMVGVAAAVALVLLGMGIRLLNRRPLFLPPKALLIYVAVAFAPMILACGGLFFREGSAALLIPVGLFLASLAVLLLMVRKAAGMIMFFNVTEDMLYDRLGASLDDAGLNWQESRSRVEIPDRDASVKVNIQGALQSGSLLVRGEDSEPVRGAVAQLPDHFDGERLERRSFVGIAYTVMGVLLLAMQGFALVPLITA